LSKLDNLIKKHMLHITYQEHRPFSYVDFLEFYVDGQRCNVASGTFRNKICSVFKDEVEVLYYSPVGNYTLKGSTVVNSVTSPHTGDTTDILDPNPPDNTNKYSHICNHPVYKGIKNLPWGKRSIHDIRLRFEIPRLWNYLLLNNYTISNSNNQSIYLLDGEANNIEFKLSIHKSDTISISLGCSYFPIEIDIHGIMRLWNTLAIIEERLRLTINCDTFTIPTHKRWIVTMWHFSRDALISYSGKRYNVEFGLAKEMLLRIYTKDWSNGKKKVRIEIQEYPMKAIQDAIEDKLNQIGLDIIW
jgi:hypothetical protein